MAESKLEIALKEELQRWEILGMRAGGVPAGFQAPGISVEIFELEMRLHTAINLLIEKGIITQEEADEKYQQNMLDRLTAIREANEEQIKKARMAQQIAVAQKSILGPNGQPFN